MNNKLKRTMMYEDHAIFISGAIYTEQHKHHALELIVSLDGIIRIQDDNASTLHSKAVLVMPDHPHQTTTEGNTAFLFIEPESALAARIKNRFSQKAAIMNVQSQIPKTLFGSLSRGEMSELIDNVEETNLTSFDDRIERVTGFIKANITTQEISLDSLADEACLSTSRLAHLFKEEIGIPLRPFILWCRMREAVSAVLSGMTLTQAAHQAGFADAAHLSRTFTDMFGINPSSVLKQ
jgi:AraC-like DNA-binding protein